MNEDQIITQRQRLIDDLNKVIESHKVHIGCGMVSTDVLGAIEAVKLRFYMEEINQ